MSDVDLAFESITVLAAKIRARAVSPVALAEAQLERIAALDDTSTSFIAVTRDRALAEARAAELALRGGQDLGPLHGIIERIEQCWSSGPSRRMRCMARALLSWFAMPRMT